MPCTIWHVSMSLFPIILGIHLRNSLFSPLLVHSAALAWNTASSCAPIFCSTCRFFTKWVPVCAPTPYTHSPILTSLSCSIFVQQMPMPAGGPYPAQVPHMSPSHAPMVAAAHQQQSPGVGPMPMPAVGGPQMGAQQHQGMPPPPQGHEYNAQNAQQGYAQQAQQPQQYPQQQQQQQQQGQQPQPELISFD